MFCSVLWCCEWWVLLFCVCVFGWTGRECLLFVFAFFVWYGEWCLLFVCFFFFFVCFACAGGDWWIFLSAFVVCCLCFVFACVLFFCSLLFGLLCLLFFAFFVVFFCRFFCFFFHDLVNRVWVEHIPQSVEDSSSDNNSGRDSNSNYYHGIGVTYTIHISLRIQLRQT